MNLDGVLIPLISFLWGLSFSNVIKLLLPAATGKLTNHLGGNDDIIKVNLGVLNVSRLIVVALRSELLELFL